MLFNPYYPMFTAPNPNSPMNPINRYIIIGSLICNSYKFKLILESLDNDDQRRLMTEFVKENQEFKHNLRQEIEANDAFNIFATLKKMVEFVDAIPGMNPEEREKINDLYKQATIEFDNDEKALIQELAAMTDPIDKQQRIKEQSQRKAEMVSDLVHRAREVCYGFQGLSPDQFNVIKGVLDKVEQGEVPFYQEAGAKYTRFVLDKFRGSGIPQDLINEAIIISEEVAADYYAGRLSATDYHQLPLF